MTPHSNKRTLQSSTTPQEVSSRLRIVRTDKDDDHVWIRGDSDFPSTEQGRTGWFAYDPISYEGSYSSAPASTSEEIEPGVSSMPPASGEVDVWLTEWQVAEDHLQVTLNETVTWKLVPMDQEWITRLFAERRAVSLQLDTYADATRGPESPDWTQVSGLVVRVDQVSVLYVRSTDRFERGLVPERGKAVVHTVPSIWPKQPHHGHVSGWIIRLRLGQRI